MVGLVISAIGAVALTRVLEVGPFAPEEPRTTVAPVAEPVEDTTPDATYDSPTAVAEALRDGGLDCALDEHPLDREKPAHTGSCTAADGEMWFIATITDAAYAPHLREALTSTGEDGILVQGGNWLLIFPDATSLKADRAAAILGGTTTPIPGTPATPETTAPATPAGATIPGDGTFLVPSEAKPGTYRTSNPEGNCYWARLSGLTGELDDVIANDNASGPAVVTIKPTDKAFETARCGEWTKVG